MQKDLPKDPFFRRVHASGLALTYADVRLRTGFSKVMPDDVNLESRFSRNTPLVIPIVSAAMDTVTEYKMAIAMAKLGGLGVIHKNLSPEDQAAQVAKVKFHLNGLITKPIFFYEDDSIQTILDKRREKDYGFQSFPILNRDGCLVGILTETDFEFCKDPSLSVRGFMTKPILTSSPDTNVQEAYRKMQGAKRKVLPLVDAQGKLTGLYVLSDVKRIISGNPQGYNTDKNGQLRVAAAIGVYDDAYSRLELLTESGVDVVVIDTAHGDSRPVFETLREIKKKYDIDVVAGNISEAESARRLIRAGADGLKVGQGPGAICTTRMVAGIGTPQVTAVYECCRIARKSNIPVCADGGLTISGDIPIAIGAGASSVMMGNMLAGTNETPGKTLFEDGRQLKDYRGMGSMAAMESNAGSRQRYSQGKGPLVPEGVEARVDFKGGVAKVMAQYIGGLRKGMGYVGAADIKELQTKARFIRMTEAGKAESHPHDLTTMRKAPNYEK